jgi:alkaline phosphatase D
MQRRRFLGMAAAGMLGPAVIRRDGTRPATPSGVQAGDVTADGGVVWSRTDRPARLEVEWARDERFTDSRKAWGTTALEGTDFTARLVLRDLPSGEPVFYRVRFHDLADPGAVSEPVGGSFRTAPTARRDVRFVWGGDVCGQGWGIDPDRGGLATFEAMRRVNPDFFIHSGDCVYADNPMQREVRLDDGSIWRNQVTPAKAKVAETLSEFHGNYAYNLTDENLRRFNAQVPVIAQWDDHEVVNNWYPGELLDDARYTVKSASLLAARGRRAFLDYLPLRPNPEDPERIYRAYPYGPGLEVFMLDARSERGRNTGNRQPEEGPDTAFLGNAQVAWLQRRLQASRATWKVIACDMPLGLIVGDGAAQFEAVANGNGPALGRELEIARLLRFIRDQGIRNVIWVTADVHYAAAHYYDPNRARFQEFAPFWEFVAGPLHAGNFGPGALDDTFGPQVRFHSVKPGTKANRPPSEGHQYFGQVHLAGETGVLTVTLHNARGEEVHREVLASG